MNKVKIKRLPKKSSKIDSKAKILAGLGAASALTGLGAGGGQGVIAKQPQSIVSAQNQDSPGKSKIKETLKNIFSSTIGAKEAKAMASPYQNNEPLTDSDLAYLKYQNDINARMFGTGSGGGGSGGGGFVDNSSQSSASDLLTQSNNTQGQWTDASGQTLDQWLQSQALQNQIIAQQEQAQQQNSAPSAESSLIESYISDQASRNGLNVMNNPDGSGYLVILADGTNKVVSYAEMLANAQNWQNSLNNPSVLDNLSGSQNNTNLEWLNPAYQASTPETAPSQTNTVNPLDTVQPGNGDAVPGLPVGTIADVLPGNTTVMNQNADGTFSPPGSAARYEVSSEDGNYHLLGDVNVVATQESVPYVQTDYSNIGLNYGASQQETNSGLMQGYLNILAGQGIQKVWGDNDSTTFLNANGDYVTVPNSQLLSEANKYFSTTTESTTPSLWQGLEQGQDNTSQTVSNQSQDWAGGQNQQVAAAVNQDNSTPGVQTVADSDLQNYLDQNSQNIVFDIINSAVQTEPVASPIVNEDGQQWFVDSQTGQKIALGEQESTPVKEFVPTWLDPETVKAPDLEEPAIEVNTDIGSLPATTANTTSYPAYQESKKTGLLGAISNLGKKTVGTVTNLVNIPKLVEQSKIISSNNVVNLDQTQKARSTLRNEANVAGLIAAGGLPVGSLAGMTSASGINNVTASEFVNSLSSWSNSNALNATITFVTYTQPASGQKPVAVSNTYTNATIQAALAFMQNPGLVTAMLGLGTLP